MSTAAISAPELSNSEAKQLLEKGFNASVFGIRLGPLYMTSIDLDQLGNIIKPYYKTLKAYEKFDIIALQEDQCLQNYQAYLKTNDQNKIDQVSHLCYGSYSEGALIVGKIIVQKTHKGEEIAQKSGFSQREDVLLIRHGTFQVDKIVKNEAHRKGVDEYRVVMCTYKVQITPEFKQAQAILGNPISEEGKSITLLKFDPFKSEWVRIASDVANINEDFKTNDVSKKLAE